MSIKVAIVNGKEPSGDVGGVSDVDLSAVMVDFINPGAVGTDAFKVTPPGGTARQVVIKAGRYYAANATGSMIYVVDLDEDYPLDIPPNGSANPRKDAIVLKIDLGTTPNNLADNIASVVDVQGTPAVSPVVPDASAIQTEVGSGNVGVNLGEVTASGGFTTISSGDIADTRTTAQLDKDRLDPLGTDQYGDGTVTSEKTKSTIAFRAYRNGSQSTAATSWVKVAYDSESFDEGSDFDTSSGKFTAPVDGIYHFNARSSFAGSYTIGIIALYVNGTVASEGNDIRVSANASTVGLVVASDIKLSAGDEVEVYVYCSNTLSLEVGTNGPRKNYLSGHLVGRT